jgi:hypothetical protein
VLGGFAAGLKPLEFVQYLVAEGIIEWSDVTHRLLADTTLPADHFKALVSRIYTDHAFEESDRKQLVNHFIGSWGSRHTRSVRAVVCEDYDYCTATVVAEEENGRLCTVDHIPNDDGTGLYFIQSESAVAKTHSALPMHRQVICQTYIRLHTLAKELLAANPGSEVMSYNTDAITLRLTAAFVLPEHLIPTGV